LTTLFELILKAKGNQFPRDVAVAVRPPLHLLLCCRL
jgi:hypothetical protein